MAYEYQEYPKFLYHPTLAPEGKIFQSAEETKGLAKKGWVDTPTADAVHDFFTSRVSGRGQFPAFRVGRQPYGGELRLHRRCQRQIVEAGHGHVPGHPQAKPAGGLAGARGQDGSAPVPSPR